MVERRFEGKGVIGVVHLAPLPGSPDYGDDPAPVREAAMIDADALAAGGVDALLVENFGDAPFFPGSVMPVTVSHMAVLAMEIRARTSLPVGINVLRNDGRAALAVAQAVGGEFIRVNVLTGARLTDQGIVQGIAASLLRERAATGARNIRILADVDVKHSTPLAPVDLENEVEDLVHRGGADGVIVSGSATGKPVNPEHVTRVKTAAGDTPVLVGSGVTRENAGGLLDVADGLIVGTWFKRDGKVGNRVDPDRVRALMESCSMSPGTDLRTLTADDWPRVRAIYEQGIATGNATFETEAPPWSAWDENHLPSCRLVATTQEKNILGWAAITPVSDRCAYAGVGDVSVYVDAAAQGKGVGRLLLTRLIEESEEAGLWTLTAGIFPENAASLRLHQSLGFRVLGVRERLGQMAGIWRDVISLERRSDRVGV